MLLLVLVVQVFGSNARFGNGFSSIKLRQGRAPSLAMCYGVFQPAIVYCDAGCDCGDLGRQMSLMLICFGSRESTSVSLTELYSAKTPGLAPHAPHHRGYCGPPQEKTGVRLG